MKLLIASLLIFFGTLIAAALVVLGEPGASVPGPLQAGTAGPAGS